MYIMYLQYTIDVNKKHCGEIKAATVAGSNQKKSRWKYGKPYEVCLTYTCTTDTCGEFK